MLRYKDFFLKLRKVFVSASVNIEGFFEIIIFLFQYFFYELKNFSLLKNWFDALLSYFGIDTIEYYVFVLYLFLKKLGE